MKISFQIRVKDSNFGYKDAAPLCGMGLSCQEPLGRANIGQCLVCSVATDIQTEMQSTYTTRYERRMDSEAIMNEGGMDLVSNGVWGWLS